MYPAPNPAGTIITTAQETVARLRAHATPPPKTGPYETGWDGKHCSFIYSPQTLLAFPPVPQFKA